MTAQPIAETRVPRTKALLLADRLAALFHPHVEQLEVAGSVRRRKEDVKDLEFVLIPKPTWYTYTDELVKAGHLEKRLNKLERTIAWSNKERCAVHLRTGIPLDMFVADADNYGYVLALRTGPGDVNRRLMQWLIEGDAPIRSRDGYWWHGDQRLKTPTENDFFAMLGMPFIEPEQRTMETYRQYLNDPAREWPDFSRWYIHTETQSRMFDVRWYGQEVADSHPEKRQGSGGKYQPAGWACLDNRRWREWALPSRFAYLHRHPELQEAYFAEHPELEAEFLEQYPDEGGEA